MNLESSARSLLDQFPASRREDLDRRERRIEKFGQIAFGGFIFVIGIAVLVLIYAILDRMVFSGKNPLVGFVLTAVVIFAMLTLTYVFFREDLKSKREKASGRTAPPELEAPESAPRMLDESRFEPVPTVTENTTDLLPRRNRES